VNPHLTAQDVWPLVRELPPAERLRLLAMASALGAHDPPGDATRYAAALVQAGALDAEDSGLAWEPEGWDEFYAPG
jgi:hypothetical protein